MILTKCFKLHFSNALLNFFHLFDIRRRPTEGKKTSKIRVFMNVAKKKTIKIYTDVAVAEYSGINNLFTFKVAETYLAISIQRETTRKSTSNML